MYGAGTVDCPRHRFQLPGGPARQAPSECTPKERTWSPGPAVGHDRALPLSGHLRADARRAARLARWRWRPAVGMPSAGRRNTVGTAILHCRAGGIVRASGRGNAGSGGLSSGTVASAGRAGSASGGDRRRGCPEHRRGPPASAAEGSLAAIRRSMSCPAQGREIRPGPVSLLFRWRTAFQHDDAAWPRAAGAGIKCLDDGS